MSKFIVLLKLVLTLHLISFFFCSMGVACLKIVVSWQPHRLKQSTWCWSAAFVFIHNIKKCCILLRSFGSPRWTSHLHTRTKLCLYFYPSPRPTHYEIAHIYRTTLSDTGFYKEIIIDLTLLVYILHPTHAKVKFSNSGNTLLVKSPIPGHKWWSNARGLPGGCWSFACKPDSTSRFAISCINLGILRSFIFIAQFFWTISGRKAERLIS